jgi:hypothetical protein
MLRLFVLNPVKIYGAECINRGCFMKSELLLVLALSGLCCTEVISTGHSYCFSINGKTFDGSDSTILKDVTLLLTDFQGNLISPIEDEYFYSDTLGVFDVNFCMGYMEVKERDHITMYILDSCKIILSKDGYDNDTITHYYNSTSDTTIDVYMNKN